jgi:hypothetical protein
MEKFQDVQSSGLPKRVYVENTECLTYMSTKKLSVTLYKYVGTYKHFSFCV